MSAWLGDGAITEDSPNGSAGGWRFLTPGKTRRNTCKSSFKVPVIVVKF
jgi:hypothetical protein